MSAVQMDGRLHACVRVTCTCETLHTAGDVHFLLGRPLTTTSPAVWHEKSKILLIFLFL